MKQVLYPEKQLDKPELLFEYLKDNENLVLYINNSYAHKAKTNEQVCALMRRNEIYAKFLANNKNLKNKDKLEFVNNCILLLNNYKNKFWLFPALDSFSFFLKEIKNNTIDLVDRNYYIPDEKLLEGASQYYSNNLQLFINDKVIKRKLKIAEKHKKIDRFIELLLSNFKENNN